MFLNLLPRLIAKVHSNHLLISTTTEVLGTILSSFINFISLLVNRGVFGLSVKDFILPPVVSLLSSIVSLI